MSKSEHMLNYTTFRKLDVSKINLNLNLKLFSEKDYKVQEHIFNHSLALFFTVEVFCYLLLRNHWTST